MKHTNQLNIASNKMSKEQFNEWVSRQQHGQLKATKVRNTITVSSNCFYTLEDAMRDLNDIALNGYM